MFFERFHRTVPNPTKAARRTNRALPVDPDLVRRHARATDGPFGGARLGI